MVLILKLDDEPPSMVSNVLTLAVPRLKREEHNCTEYDSHFSNWKVIVGPRDWEDYSVHKDGAERYRGHNLPKDESPGVYELGVAVLPNGSGRGIKADQIVPVYVGQADSARTRLQRYGRTGAHLGKSCSVGNQSELICTGPGLFQKMMARGYTIVYRWAPMRSKSEALRIERKLLDTFDYAWNTKSNGSRRHDDVCQELEKRSSHSTRFTTNLPRHLPFRQKQACIRINSSNLISTDEKFSHYADRESRNLIPHVIKFGRSQPRLVLDGSGIMQENTIVVCGVIGGDGLKCRKAPVQGRKRCAEHKGIKNAGSTTDRNREIVSYESGVTWENAEICGVTAGDGSTCRRPPVQGRKRCAEHKGMWNTGSSTASNRDLVTYKSVNWDTTEICGVVASDGSTCKRPPVQGRKRCAEHKGMWNTGSSTASNRDLVTYKSVNWDTTEICGVVASDGSTCKRPPVQGRKRCAEHKGMWNTGSSTASTKELVTYKTGFTWENTEICGVAASDGSTCKRPPVQGRKRCAEHKGMWSTGSSTASTKEFVTYKTGLTWENTEICGAAASDGSTCKRPPVQGRKRCAEHKGMWSTGSSTASTKEFVTYKTGFTWENTEICGVATGDGSPCRRSPVQGRKRCAEHKGMWNTGLSTASSREFVSYKSHITREYTEICGATTSNGSPCKRSPVNGRVRCAMHKGRRS